jgi:hypothetical protein
VGEQLSLMMRVEAGELSTTIRLALRPTSCTASAAEDPATSMIAATRPGPNHSRALAEAMSALLLWSAATTSIGRPRTRPPKSSAAIFAAVSLPGPFRSA